MEYSLHISGNITFGLLCTCAHILISILGIRLDSVVSLWYIGLCENSIDLVPYDHLKYLHANENPCFIYQGIGLISWLPTVRILMPESNET